MAYLELVHISDKCIFQSWKSETQKPAIPHCSILETLQAKVIVSGFNITHPRWIRRLDTSSNPATMYARPRRLPVEDQSERHLEDTSPPWQQTALGTTLDFTLRLSVLPQGSEDEKHLYQGCTLHVAKWAVHLPGRVPRMPSKDTRQKGQHKLGLTKNWGVGTGFSWARWTD